MLPAYSLPVKPVDNKSDGDGKNAAKNQGCPPAQHFPENGQHNRTKDASQAAAAVSNPHGKTPLRGLRNLYNPPVHRGRDNAEGDSGKEGKDQEHPEKG